MSLKNLAAKAGNATILVEKTAKKNSAVTSPGAALIYQEQLHLAENRANQAEAELSSLKKQAKGSFEVDISKLIERPGRRRKLSSIEFSELRENLRNNALIHPISIVALENGNYEIISGHNRVDIYKDFGKTTIPAVEIKISSEQADNLAFFANLMQAPLGDYEKYLGFVRLKERTSSTQKELAKLSGIADSTLSTLMSFSRLPDSVQRILAQYPSVLGMNVAVELAKLCATNPSIEETIIKAVLDLADGKITQSEVLLRCKRSAAAPILRSKPTISKIKAGRYDYCKVTSLGNSMRIDFKDEGLRSEAEKRITELLNEIASTSVTS